MLPSNRTQLWRACCLSAALGSVPGGELELYPLRQAVAASRQHPPPPPPPPPLPPPTVCCQSPERKVRKSEAASERFPSPLERCTARSRGGADIYRLAVIIVSPPPPQV